jgi:uncharacterized protein
VKIRVADITEKEKVLGSSEPASVYPSLQQAQEAGEVTFLKPVDVSLSIVSEYGHIRVKGQVGTTVALSCSRCLVDYNSDIVSNFTIYLTKATGIVEEDEVELAEEDLLSVTYDGDVIDLAHEIAEQVLLELPYKPLCSEECLGLCPVCGGDRNSTRCDCMENRSTMAFSSLGGFKVKQ